MGTVNAPVAQCADTIGVMEFPEAQLTIHLQSNKCWHDDAFFPSFCSRRHCIAGLRTSGSLLGIILRPFPSSMGVMCHVTHHVITATGVPNAQPDVALVVDRRGVGELVRLQEETDQEGIPRQRAAAWTSPGSGPAQSSWTRSIRTRP